MLWSSSKSLTMRFFRFAQVIFSLQGRGLLHARGIVKRLLAIPIAYLLLRVWNAFQIALGVTTLKDPLACSSHDKQVAAFVIAIMQVSKPVLKLLILQ